MALHSLSLKCWLWPFKLDKTIFKDYEVNFTSLFSFAVSIFVFYLIVFLLENSLTHQFCNTNMYIDWRNIYAYHSSGLTCEIKKGAKREGKNSGKVNHVPNSSKIFPVTISWHCGVEDTCILIKRSWRIYLCILSLSTGCPVSNTSHVLRHTYKIYKIKVQIYILLWRSVTRSLEWV